jgi:hypothetical protein
MGLNEFREYFRNMNSPWHFANPDDTRKVHLHNDRVIHTNRDIYSKFVVCNNETFRRTPTSSLSGDVRPLL